MKSKKMIRRILALIVVMALTAVFAVQAFAGSWLFGSTGQGSNPFSPRGYSIAMPSGNSYVEKWLVSNYDHAQTKAGNKWTATVGTNDNSLEISSISAGTYQFHAWLDKNPTGSVLCTNYKSNLAVYINNSTTPTKLNQLPSNYAVSIGDATTAYTDANGQSNQWSIPFTMTLQAGETYRFVFLRGFEANNSNTLVLYPSSVGNSGGYIGYVTSSNATTDEEELYEENAGEVYTFITGKTSLGQDGNNRYVYSLTTASFDHQITATT